MIILLELMMQQLAAATGRDPDEYRQAHMLQLPQAALTAAAAAAAAAAPAGPDDVPVPSAARATAEQQQEQHEGTDTQQQLIPHPKYLPNSSNSDSSDSDSDSSSSSCVSMKTSLGQVIEVHHYTLPYMMQQVQAGSDYRARKIAVEAFNNSHSSRKRGLALVPVRWVGLRGRGGYKAGGRGGGGGLIGNLWGGGIEAGG
jgi:hypothetical protein